MSAAQGTGRQTFTQAMHQRAGSQPVAFCLVQLILSGVFDRFPEIRFYFAETNASWLPGTLYFLDDNYALYRDTFGLELQMKPSEYLSSGRYFCSVERHEGADMYDAVTRFLGDGVLMYPGEEKVHPEEDRGIPGPCSTVQLANLRRGLQDHLYLTMARRLGLKADVHAALAAVVPRVFSDAGETVGFAESGEAFEGARRALGRAIAARLAKGVR